MSRDELADRINRFGVRYARHDGNCVLALAAEAALRRGVSIGVGNVCTCGLLAAKMALMEAVREALPEW